MKGLILSGGSGTRLRPLTHTSAKQLVPVANQPVIFYGIEALVEAGIKDIGIVIAPHTGEEIKDAVGDGANFGAKITYILQAEPKGLAHAVLTAKDFINGSDFVMYLGDNILRDGVVDLVNDFKKKQPDTMILLTEVEDPSAYGIVELEGEKIIRLQEKPANPKSNLALVGVYIFTKKIFQAAERIKPSDRGELEITEAIEYLLNQGLDIEYSVVDGWWKDTGTVDEILAANRLILSSVKENIQGNIKDSDITGQVIIERGAKVIDSTIRGPVVIAKGANIKNSYIGPNTAIDENVNIKNSEIEHSIVLANSEINDIETRIEASLIAKNVTINKKTKPPKALTFVLGENSDIEIG